MVARVCWRWINDFQPGRSCALIWRYCRCVWRVSTMNKWPANIFVAVASTPQKPGRAS